MGVSLSREEFVRVVSAARAEGCGAVVAPLSVRLMSDLLTPVLAYRRLVSADERAAPSFLFESVEQPGEGGGRQGRHSMLGARPVLLVRADGERVRVRRRGGAWEPAEGGAGRDPLAVIKGLTSGWRPVGSAESALGLAGVSLPGWVGYAGYDSVRYAEPGKLPWASAPRDDRGLADVQFCFYDEVVVFDHVQKVAHVVVSVVVGEGDDASSLYGAATERLGALSGLLGSGGPALRPGRLPAGRVMGDRWPAEAEGCSTMSRGAHAAMVERAREFIAAGDVFQVVVGQRFAVRSAVDPFDVYRALRVVNPSPYMVYLQGAGCILVASSPEILCRVERRGGEGGALVVTNRPLAGTRRRGRDAGEDSALERELLADGKERAEHVMLVDLGRNDVGRVSSRRSVRLERVMEVERYSHVMHISSTVTGVLRDGLDCWDALRAALPVGTISGAPKIRAMQIIDELEAVKRGPYGGGMGYVSLDGAMDIALALRTIVCPTEGASAGGPGGWVYHLQAAGGIVHDSRAAEEYAETVNKAAALREAIAVAECAFGC